MKGIPIPFLRSLSSALKQVERRTKNAGFREKIFDTVGNVLASLLNVMQVLEHGAFLKRLLDSPEFKKNFEVSRRGSKNPAKI